MKTTNKLELKDLITIGLFAAIYFAGYAVITMVAIVPIFVILVPGICALLLGIPTMLFCAKVPKFGAYTLYGLIIGLLMVLIGMGWWLMACSLALGFLADLIMLSGKYKSFARTLIGYVLFGFWSLPVCLPIWLSTEEYAARLAKGYGESYGAQVASLATGWAAVLMVAVIIVGSVAGTLIGKRVLKKHFVKAGIV